MFLVLPLALKIVLCYIVKKPSKPSARGKDSIAGSLRFEAGAFLFSKIVFNQVH